jgi:hypothetical protein
VPICDASLSETNGFINSIINFDGSLSKDPDGSIESYQWDFDDGTTGMGMIVSHQFSEPGQYDVTLMVTDDEGASCNDTIQVIISTGNNPPSKPVIEGPVEGERNERYTFTFLSSDVDGDQIKYQVDWGDQDSFSTEFGSANTSVILSHNWTSSGRYKITVIADDNKTVSASNSHTIFIDAIEISYDNSVLGVLGDDNGDGVYDKFNDKTDLIFYDDTDDIYLLDIDDDGIWDYTYNPLLNMVSINMIKDDRSDNGESSIDMILIVGMIIILLIIIAIAGIIIKYKKK